MKSQPRKLMIISSDKISDWIKKGEVTPRYYNPGNVFSEVHLVLLNEEAIKEETLSVLVGDAKVQIYTFPTGIPHFVKTLFWSPSLLRQWARPILKLATRIKPDMVRCHGAMLNAFLAREIKRQLGIPYVVSLHINYDADVRQRKMGALKRIRDFSYRRFEGDVLRGANKVLPVYKPIVPYLNRHGVRDFEVAYNFLNTRSLGQKKTYTLGKPIRIISVGRQIEAKNPVNLIHAIVQLPEVELTLVGDGPIHDFLRTTARELGIESRVHFVRAMDNDSLCRTLVRFDIFATHTEYWEISKSILEALLTGLPVVLNTRLGAAVPELNEESICSFVENSPRGYEEGLKRLINDDLYRETLGRRALAYSRKRWDPQVTEKKFADIYRTLLKEELRENA